MNRQAKFLFSASTILLGMFGLNACGSDPVNSEDSSKKSDSSKNLPECTRENDAETATLEGDANTYVCKDKSWEILDTTFVANDTASTLDDIPNCADKQDGNSYYIEESGVNYICEDNRWEIVVVSEPATSSTSKESSSSSSGNSSSVKKSSSSQASSKQSSNSEDEQNENEQESSSSKALSSSSAKSSSSVKASSSSAMPSSSSEAVSSSEESSSSVAESSSSRNVAANLDTLQNCTDTYEGEIYYVESESAEYICTNREWSRLCGSVAINDTTQFCKDGKALNKADYCNYDENGESFPLTDYYCAGTDIYLKTEYSPCGAKYYYIPKYFCSNDSIYTLCGGKEYDPATQFCADSVAYAIADYDTCLNEYGQITDAANKATEFCSSGKAYPLCNDTTYDVTKYFCYTNDSASKLIELCNGNSYDLATEFCAFSEEGLLSVFSKETYCSAKKSISIITIDVAHLKSDYICVNTKNYGWALGAYSRTEYGECSEDNIYNLATQFCGIDSVVYNFCNSEEFDPTKYFCVDDKLYDLCGGKKYTPKTDGVCKDSNYYYSSNDSLYFEDLRDNQTYSYVLIGDQYWMAENLGFEADTTTYCREGISGCYYMWNTAITACPTGWHLPDSTEWRTLGNYVDANNGDEGAGTSLKSTDTSFTKVFGKWYIDTTKTYDVGTNAFGFNAVPAGNATTLPSETITEWFKYAYYWSADTVEGTSPRNYYWVLDNNSAYFYKSQRSSSIVPLNFKISVRCLKDSE